MYFWIVSSLITLALYGILSWENSLAVTNGLKFLSKALNLQQLIMITFVLGLWAGYSICKMLNGVRLVGKNEKVVEIKKPVDSEDGKF